MEFLLFSPIILLGLENQNLFVKSNHPTQEPLTPFENHFAYGCPLDVLLRHLQKAHSGDASVVGGVCIPVGPLTP